MKKVTLKDIANELGVTVGTVSHVLNGINDISEPTRLRVLETAERLGYVSNNAAVSLRSGRTRTVAVIVPDVSNPHIAHQVKLIEERLREARYSVIILNTGEDEASEKEAILTACGKQVDGILLCPTQKSKRNLRFCVWYLEGGQGRSGSRVLQRSCAEGSCSNLRMHCRRWCCTSGFIRNTDGTR